MDAGEVFRKALELISDEARWTKGESARNAEGQRCRPSEGAAVCWCSSGAIDHFRQWKAGDLVRNALNVGLPDANEELVPLAHFNDTHTHAEVIAHWRATGERMGWLPKQESQA